jgi:hypothetical protein
MECYKYPCFSEEQGDHGAFQGVPVTCLSATYRAEQARREAPSTFQYADGGRLRLTPLTALYGCPNRYLGSTG